MSIPVKREPDNCGLPMENCCMCRTPTPYWYGSGPLNVALCESCANKHSEEDLPTKAEWLAKERRLNPRLVRYWGGEI